MSQGFVVLLHSHLTLSLLHEILAITHDFGTGKIVYSLLHCGETLRRIKPLRWKHVYNKTKTTTILINLDYVHVI